MNTIELTSIIKRRIFNRTNFVGVLACDQLPKNISKYPTMLIVNTHPSFMPGEHWVAIYITKDKDGYFFDSFGHSPENRRFPPEIKHFLRKNCVTVSYSGRVVQSELSTKCGQHCVFFLCNIQKGMSYKQFINMYGPDPVCNDAMVCRFVNRIQPVAVCHEYDTMCVQCVEKH